jgi:hypothetical protein
MLSFVNKGLRTTAVRNLILLRGIGTQVTQKAALAMEVPSMHQNYEARTTIKWMDPNEVDRLFNTDTKQVSGDAKANLAELNKIYAVDAPDGETDGHLQEEIEEITHIIEDAADHEDTEAVLRRHAMKTACDKIHARDPEHDW